MSSSILYQSYIKPLKKIRADIGDECLTTKLNATTNDDGQYALFIDYVSKKAELPITHRFKNFKFRISGMRPKSNLPQIWRPPLHEENETVKFTLRLSLNRQFLRRREVKKQQEKLEQQRAEKLQQQEEELHQTIPSNSGHDNATVATRDRSQLLAIVNEKATIAAANEKHQQKLEAQRLKQSFSKDDGVNNNSRNHSSSTSTSTPSLSNFLESNNRLKNRADGHYRNGLLYNGGNNEDDDEEEIVLSPMTVITDLSSLDESKSRTYSRDRNAPPRRKKRPVKDGNDVVTSSGTANQINNNSSGRMNHSSFGSSFSRDEELNVISDDDDDDEDGSYTSAENDTDHNTGVTTLSKSRDNAPQHAGLSSNRSVKSTASQRKNYDKSIFIKTRRQWISKIENVHKIANVYKITSMLETNSTHSRSTSYYRPSKQRRSNKKKKKMPGIDPGKKTKLAIRLKLPPRPQLSPKSAIKSIDIPQIALLNNVSNVNLDSERPKENTKKIISSILKTQESKLSKSMKVQAPPAAAAPVVVKRLSPKKLAPLPIPDAEAIPRVKCYYDNAETPKERFSEARKYFHSLKSNYVPTPDAVAAAQTTEKENTYVNGRLITSGKNNSNSSLNYHHDGVNARKYTNDDHNALNRSEASISDLENDLDVIDDVDEDVSEEEEEKKDDGMFCGTTELSKRRTSSNSMQSPNDEVQRSNSMQEPDVKVDIYSKLGGSSSDLRIDQAMKKPQRRLSTGLNHHSSSNNSDRVKSSRSGSDLHPMRRMVTKGNSDGTLSMSAKLTPLRSSGHRETSLMEDMYRNLIDIAEAESSRANQLQDIEEEEPEKENSKKSKKSVKRKKSGEKKSKVKRNGSSNSSFDNSSSLLSLAEDLKLAGKTSSSGSAIKKKLKSKKKSKKEKKTSPTQSPKSKNNKLTAAVTEPESDEEPSSPLSSYKNGSLPEPYRTKSNLGKVEEGDDEVEESTSSLQIEDLRCLQSSPSLPAETGLLSKQSEKRNTSISSGGKVPTKSSKKLDPSLLNRYGGSSSNNLNSSSDLSDKKQRDKFSGSGSSFAKSSQSFVPTNVKAPVIHDVKLQVPTRRGSVNNSGPQVITNAAKCTTKDSSNNGDTAAEKSSVRNVASIWGPTVRRNSTCASTTAVSVAKYGSKEESNDKSNPKIMSGENKGTKKELNDSFVKQATTTSDHKKPSIYGRRHSLQMNNNTTATPVSPNSAAVGGEKKSRRSSLDNYTGKLSGQATNANDACAGKVNSRFRGSNIQNLVSKLGIQ